MDALPWLGSRLAMDDPDSAVGAVNVVGALVSDAMSVYL
jgi:hypothetical protein